MQCQAAIWLARRQEIPRSAPVSRTVRPCLEGHRDALATLNGLAFHGRGLLADLSDLGEPFARERVIRREAGSYTYPYLQRRAPLQVRNLVCRLPAPAHDPVGLQ